MAGRGTDNNSERKASFPRWQWLLPDGKWWRSCQDGKCACGSIAYEDDKKSALERGKYGPRPPLGARLIRITRHSRLQFEGDAVGRGTEYIVDGGEKWNKAYKEFCRRHCGKRIRCIYVVLP